MGKREDRPAGWRDLRQAGQVGQLVLLCFGVWLHAADGLMVATLIPSIIGDIGGAGFIAWTFALYELGSIVAGASSALLAQRLGLRAAMTGGALVYLVGCVLSALAPEIYTMLLGRLCQGLGGGGLVALSFVTLNVSFPRALLARAMAAISAVWGLSAFTGPLVGGVFADLDLWRGGFWFFALQAGLLALWIFLGLRGRIAGPAEARQHHLPLGRLSVLSLGVIMIAAAGIEVTPYRSPLLVLAGLCLITLFLVLDGRRGAARLLPARPFDPRHPVGAALLLILCFSAATVAIGAYGPALMARLFGASALTAGYIVALTSIGWSTMAVVASGAAERHDGRLILAGSALITVSLLGFALAMPRGPLALIALCSFLEGAGFGTAWTFVLRRTTALAQPEDASRFAAALPTVQRLGYAIGAALAGIIANAAGFAASLEPATARAVGFWIFAALLPVAGIGLAGAWRLVSFPLAAPQPSSRS